MEKRLWIDLYGLFLACSVCYVGLVLTGVHSLQPSLMDPWSYGMMTLHNLIIATGIKMCEDPLLAFQLG